MFYIKNLPGWERLLRLCGGAIVMIYAVSDVGGLLEWVLAAGGGGIALSGLIGFCPMCALAGRRLQKHPEKSRC